MASTGITNVAIPCHQIIRQDSTLSSYRCYAGCKRALLAREARA
jgi:O6-methylguanine-DNA--protein-cysteine methyltransferase